MNAELAIELAVSAGITAALVAISFFLGAWRSVKVGEASARDRLAFDEPDFEIGEMLIGADGRAAVAIDRTGREGAVVFALGDGLSTRRFRLGAVEAGATDRALRLALHDLSKWRVEVAAPDAGVAADWARRIKGAPLDSSHGIS